MPQVTAQTGPRPRILVVDDEPGILFALQDLLEAEFDVATSERAEEALHVAAADPTIEVVMSDQRMPGMLGDELLASLRHRSGAARILCSGYADVQSIVRSVNRGQIFAFVEKPWDPTELRATLNAAVDEVRSRQAAVQSHELFTDFMQSLPRAVYVKNLQQRFVSVSSTFMAALGASDSQTLLGRRLSDIVPDLAAARELESLERAVLRDGRARQAELQLPTLQGGRRAFGASLVALRSERGDLRGVVCVYDALGPSSFLGM